MTENDGSLSLKAGTAGETVPGLVDLDVTEDNLHVVNSRSGSISAFAIDGGDASLPPIDTGRWACTAPPRFPLPRCRSKVRRVTERELLTLEPIADAPEVGRWLSALEDGRRDTLRELDGVTDELLDRRPEGSENSIGSALYHVALIEADWLLDDIFGESIEGSELQPLFPVDDRDDTGRLSVVAGESLATHLDRLGRVRQVVIERLRPSTADDFHSPRARADYDVSPAWVVHHLLQHESEHRSEIGWLRRRLTDGGR